LVWSFGFSRILKVAIPLLFFAILPTSTNAQVISTGPGIISTQQGGNEFIDLFIASPEVFNIRASTVIIYSKTNWNFLTKLSTPLSQNGPSFINVETGLSWLSFREHSPEPFVGLYASSPLPINRLSLAGAFSLEPREEWGWSAVIRLDYLLFYR
jgi:hypothetical protein